MNKKKETIDMLEVLAKRAEQAMNDSYKYVSFESEAFGTLELVRPPLKALTEWIDDFSAMDNPTTFDGLLFNARIVFECCPFFKSNFKQLSEMYNEDDPDRLVLQIFKVSEAINELSPIAEEMLSSYGAMKEELKN